MSQLLAPSDRSWQWEDAIDHCGLARKYAYTGEQPESDLCEEQSAVSSPWLGLSRREVDLIFKGQPHNLELNGAEAISPVRRVKAVDYRSCLRHFKGSVAERR